MVINGRDPVGKSQACGRDDPTRWHSPNQRRGTAGTGGDLWLSMMSGSVKARDLTRDPRVVLNSVTTSPSPSAEIKVCGTVRQ